MIQQNKTFLPMSDSIIKYSEMCIERAYLINLTNHENLKEIEKLKLKIDSKYQSVSEIGIHLTQLRILILDGSYLQSLRDFGNQFPYLQVLSVNECSLNDLDGIACFQSLIELHAANNRISELASIGFLDFLEVIIYYLNNFHMHNL